MSKAEEKTWEWASKNKLDPYSMGQAYAEGYHQAEKDIALTWQDVKAIFLLVQVEWSPNKKEEEIYQEVLKRFKDFREKKR